MTISPDTRYRRRLVVMVKDPRPGRVKTRLARDIGTLAAAQWYRHISRTTLGRVVDPRWDTLLAVTPDRAGMCSRAWPSSFSRLPQGHGDLGQRMGRLLRNLPPGPVCIVGSDIPGLHAHHVAAAFAALTRNDAVFGPATDGGYWLVGLKRVSPPPPAIFCGVRWSTPHALDDSIATLGRCKVARVAELADVDTVEDLPRHPCR